MPPVHSLSWAPRAVRDDPRVWLRAFFCVSGIPNFGSSLAAGGVGVCGTGGAESGPFLSVLARPRPPAAPVSFLLSLPFFVTDVVDERSPGPGLSCARRGTDIHGEWDRSSRAACGPLASLPHRLVVRGRRGCGIRPDLAPLPLALVVSWPGEGVWGRLTRWNSPRSPSLGDGGVVGVLPAVGRGGPPYRCATRRALWRASYSLVSVWRSWSVSGLPVQVHEAEGRCRTRSPGAPPFWAACRCWRTDLVWGLFWLLLESRSGVESVRKEEKREPTSHPPPCSWRGGVVLGGWFPPPSGVLSPRCDEGQSGGAIACWGKKGLSARPCVFTPLGALAGV